MDKTGSNWQLKSGLRHAINRDGVHVSVKYAESGLLVRITVFVACRRNICGINTSR